MCVRLETSYVSIFERLGSSGTGFFGCSCLPKAVTGVSQPGVGLESAYSGPRVELRPPVYPSPVVRADLVLVGAVHLGGGGSQRRHGYRVGDCSAEGGRRNEAGSCVRGASLLCVTLVPTPVTAVCAVCSLSTYNKRTYSMSVSRTGGRYETARRTHAAGYYAANAAPSD